MPRPPRRGHLVRWLLVLPLLLALACSDDKTAAPSASSSSAVPTSNKTSGSSTPSSSDADADVTKAYLAYWDMYFRVNDPPNANDPQITQLTTGAALPALLDIIKTNASQGLAFRIPANGVGKHTVKVLTVDGTTATLQDCSIDDGQVVRVATGEVVNGDVVTKLISATVTNEGGQWKVSHYDFLQRTPGIAQCAA